MPLSLPDQSILEKELLALITGRLLPASGNLGPKDNLQDAGLDSMAIMQLLVLIEEKYGIALPNGAISCRNFGNASAVASLLREQVEG